MLRDVCRLRKDGVLHEQGLTQEQADNLFAVCTSIGKDAESRAFTKDVWKASAHVIVNGFVLPQATPASSRR